MDIIEAHIALPLVGVAAGIVLGFVARLNRFCTLSALERYWYSGDATGLRTWVLAATVAMLATQALAAAGLADIRDSFYLRPYLGLTGAVFGGLMFGFGMAMVGTCAFGAVIRLGGGSLRSLVVLLTLGLAAISTQRGLMGQVRVALVDNLALDMTEAGGQSIPVLISRLLGVDATLAVVVLLGGGLLAWIFADPVFRRRWASIGTGTAVGLVTRLPAGVVPVPGGALMGIGGVFAMGCTIGQGVTGFSTLALSAPIAFASILLGARLGLSWMVEGSVWSMFRGRQSRHGPAE